VDIVSVAYAEEIENEITIIASEIPKKKFTWLLIY
jgi:hypothetical protein